MSDCIHPKLQLQLVVPEERLVRGDSGAWYKCECCGEQFRTDIVPYVLTVQYGMDPATDRVTSHRLRCLPNGSTSGK